MINLPQLLEVTLAKNAVLAADVRKSLNAFEPWLEQSGMPFFPGFTDHSPRHINDVLKTAAALISDRSHSLLSAEDVAVLVMAILLHDCGMHLTQDGFRALVSKKTPPLIDGLGDISWNQLWVDFLSEAQRFGEERLQAVFGDTLPIQPDSIDLNSLSERDCLLVGEFIRRHHARLAHEIAIAGVPTLSDFPLTLSGLDAEIKDLSGLIARSHGMAIRATFPYLDNRYNRVAEQRSVKAPFLMAVLRISDYVQVQSERALKALLSVKELRSPVSRQEWRNHFSVSDVTLRHEDPEAMYVHAAPTDVKTFLRLEALFKDIQHELDESWATIGEVYGRFGELSQLGLTIRRLRSNLDAREKFASSVSYIPIRAGFQSSGPDLLKLLVGPLYDYKYEVGIRELIQNAIDACRELIDLCASVKDIEQEGKTLPGVFVEIQEAEDETGWITVTDQGIGMTLDTVTKYFLVAGASFRNSDIWKKQHIEVDGSIRVIRGGRFGVGALAAFLMGDEIQVRTRHFDREESSGIEFSARMDDPVIELKKCPAPQGTSIKVWISRPEVMKAIAPSISFTGPQRDEPRMYSWTAVDWFAQKNPIVKFRWTGYIKQQPSDKNKKLVEVEFTPTDSLVPDSTDPHPDWHALTDPNPYKALLWQYPEKIRKITGDSEYFFQPSRQIVVNGIRVQKLAEYSEGSILDLPHSFHLDGPSFFIARPSLAIFDPIGACPINLQRSAVSFDRMGKDSQIAASILSQYIIRAQSLVPTELSLASYAEFSDKLNAFEGITYRGRLLTPFAANPGGLFLSSTKSFRALAIKKVFFIKATAMLPADQLASYLRADEALLLSQSSQGEQAQLAWFRAVFSESNEQWWRLQEHGFPQLMHTGETGILNSKSWELASAKGKVNRNLLKRLKQTTNSQGNVVLVSGIPNHASELLTRAQEILKRIGEGSEIYGWSLDSTSNSKEPSILMNTLDELNKEPFLIHSK